MNDELLGTHNLTHRFDVLVIGAGAAGLVAARTLAQSGRKVAVIEARDRIGGRIHTQCVPLPRSIGREGGAMSIPVELGAEFIHGLPAVSWGLIREAGLETFELQGQQLEFSHGRLGRRSEAPWNVLDAMAGWVGAHPGEDMSFARYLDLSTVSAAERAATLGYVEGFNAADSRVIGIAALAKQQIAEEQIQADRVFRVKRGYGTLPHHLADTVVKASGVLMTGTEVRRIQWRKGDVRMHCLRNGSPCEYAAPQAVISLPLGVLHAGAVEFDPLPGDLLAVAQRLAMGAACRVTFVFDACFWNGPAIAGFDDAGDGSGLSFLFAPEHVFPTWWTAAPEPLPTITGWVAGPRALDFDARRVIGPDSPEFPRPSLDMLAAALQRPAGEIRERLSSWHTHDWQSDRFARGAYSYAPAGAVDASTRLAAPIEGTLFFAGEHTDTEGHWGTVHGALSSGLRAAAQILKP